MKKYVVFNTVNNIKFYLKNNSKWEESYDNLKIFLEDEVAEFFDSKKRKTVLQTRYGKMNVEIFISYEN